MKLTSHPEIRDQLCMNIVIQTPLGHTSYLINFGC